MRPAPCTPQHTPRTLHPATCALHPASFPLNLNVNLNLNLNLTCRVRGLTWTLVDTKELSVKSGQLRHRVPCWGYVMQEKDRPGRMDAAKCTGVARVLGVGCGVWGVGCGVWGVGCGVWGAGCGV